MTPLLADIFHALEGEGVNVAALGLAWARTAPLIALVPAFGLRALPGPARVVLALSFALAILPGAGLSTRGVPGGAPWGLLVVGELLHGLPVAVATAVPLWAATMAGDLTDGLRGGQGGGVSVPVVDGQASTLGVAASMLASAIWLATGGPARAVTALLRPTSPNVLLESAQLLVSGITLAVSLAAPILVTSIVLELGLALITRAAAPAQVSTLLAPLRSVVVLGAFAIVLERFARVLATHFL